MCESLKIPESDSEIINIYSKLSPADQISLCQLNGHALRGIYPILGGKPRRVLKHFCNENNPKRIRLYLEAHETLVLPKHILMTINSEHTIYIGQQYTKITERHLRRHGLEVEEKNCCYVLSIKEISGNSIQSGNGAQSGNTTQSPNATQSTVGVQSADGTQSTNVTHSANSNQSANDTQSDDDNLSSDGNNHSSDDNNHSSDDNSHYSDDYNNSSSGNHDQSGEDDVQSGVDNDQSGRDDVQSGDDDVQSGEDNVQSGRDDVQSGDDDVQHGQDNVQSGQDDVQSGQDDVQFGQDDVQSGQDDVQSGQSYVQSGEDNVHSGVDNDKSGDDDDQSGISAKTDPMYSMRYRNLFLIPENASNEQIQSLIHATKGQFLKFVNILISVTKNKHLDLLSVSSRAFLFRIKVMNMLS